MLFFFKTLKLIVCLAVFFSYKAANSQSPVFKNYTPFDELPSSETYNSIQDSKGYMWFGTDRGIAKFDGYNFRVFTTADGLPDNTVFEFFTGNNGEIWFKTFSAELGYIRNDSIFTYRHNDKVKTLLPLQVLSYVMFGKNGSVLLTKDFTYPKDKMLIYQIDSAGNVDSFAFKAEQGVKKLFFNQRGERVTISDIEAHTGHIYEYETGKKLMSFPAKTFNRDVFVCRMKARDVFFLYSDMQVFSIEGNNATKLFDCDSNVISIFADDNKDLWLGHAIKGVERYTYKSGYKEKFTELKNHSVSSINQDREGGMWFTTLENGIYYLPPGSPAAYTQAHGLSISNVRRFEKIEDNIMIFLSDNSVFLKKNKTNGFKKIFEERAIQVSIKYVAPDKLFISNHPKLLHNFGKKIIDAFHYRIHEGTKHVWFYEPSGIRKISKNGEVLESARPNNIPRILCVYEIKNDQLLLGTTRGLYLYNSDSVESLAKYNTLYKYRVSDIKRLSDKMLVIATMGQGVFVINEADFSVRVHYTIADGLPSNLCNVAMVEGEALWVGTNKGIGHISNVLHKQKAKVLVVNIFDGLASNEINDINEVNGEVWVATPKGISILSKKLLIGKLRDIPVYIEGVSVDGKLSSLAGSNSFTYSENNIVISFIGLHFQYTGKLVYKYRLAGDKNWYTTTNRSVVYNSLPPGAYTFEVGVIKPNGEENPAIARYTFTILPPFWQTWWFITVMVLAGGAGIYLFINYRMRFIRRQEQLKNDLNSFRDKALRNHMNPHFIYNSLNSIQNYILRNNPIASSEFLAKFSQLMRLTFNNTDQERVPIEKDLEALQLYAELENLRFPDKFTLHLEHNLDAEISRLTIPPLILQPFVENAILHGLLTKKKPGNIRVKIWRNGNVLNINVTDDGIGHQQAAKIKERKERFKAILPGNKPKSSGITATLARIEQAWGKNAYKSEFKIVDLHEQADIFTGTSVSFSLPVTYD